MKMSNVISLINLLLLFQFSNLFAASDLKKGPKHCVPLSQNYESDSFAEILEQTKKKIALYGKDQVLVVLDIDNTVLTMAQNFGSDQWWTWQSTECIGVVPTPEYCVSSSFSKLLKMQGKIFALSSMVPTEDVTVETIKQMQSLGVKVILLTSRGPEFRSATEKALKDNGLNFQASSISKPGQDQGFAGKYYPYKLENPLDFGLDQSEVELMGAKSAREVSYMNGLYMTAGLNKGVMLKTLLFKTNTKFKAVIFADDHKKHTKSMQEIMGDEVDLTTYRYSKIDPQVIEFKNSDKNDAKEALKKFLEFEKTVFK